MTAHLEALQEIADDNGGSRAAATPGHDESAAYVAALLSGAGYSVTMQSFTFHAFREVTPARLSQIAPAPAVYTRSFDFGVLNESTSGFVTAPVVAVDLSLDLGNASTSGCEAGDFAGFTPGSIALLQRGACTFRLKADNATAAGASAVIIFNQGNDPSRIDLFTGTMGIGYAGVPVVAASYTRGVEWAATAGLIMELIVDVRSGDATTQNVIAESTTGDPGNVVVIGGHLDSVDRSPGIQDNGSGSAAMLETALQMARVKPRNRVRFAWWSAKEFGFLGSQFYLNSLSSAERNAIALYLSFDQLAAPNFVRFVLDGDGSTSGTPAATGSAAIEQFFKNFYSQRGQASEEIFATDVSDWVTFHNAGIPIGGITTGSFGIKTAQEASIYGGTPGEQYDPCHHLGCDTVDNVSNAALDVNSDAAAAAALTFAMNTQAVNGKKGKGNFKPKPLPLSGTALATY